MKTIVEPRKYIYSLWGKQRVNEQAVYRLMRYVLCVDYDGEVLLHNVVTGQLVVLDDEEKNALNSLPTHYSSVMESLVHDHYLVPEHYEEHKQVQNLRKILLKLHDARTNAITHYTILPTTSCNARCYYCFEHGVQSFTMTEQIADDTAEFISQQCKGQKVTILWFGGEPTVAAKSIDRICSGLKAKGVQFVSTMITNGYLLDEEMASKAKTLWNLQHVQISVDGTEQNYNRVKAYVNPQENPYQKVMRNVGYLVKEGIAVGLRMNYDLENYQDFDDLLKEVKERFNGNRLVQVYSYPIIGEYQNHEGELVHGEDDWFTKMTPELNDKARACGLYHKVYELPCLKYTNCGADDNSAITITALGEFVRCPEKFNQEQTIGNLKEGIKNFELAAQWKEQWERPECIQCGYYPRCVKLSRCDARDVCRAHDRNRQTELVIKKQYDAWKHHNKKESAKNGV